MPVTASWNKADAGQRVFLRRPALLPFLRLTAVPPPPTACCCRVPGLLMAAFVPLVPYLPAPPATCVAEAFLMFCGSFTICSLTTTTTSLPSAR